MPYVGIKTTANLSDAQKDKLKSELGRLISIIPTKAESGTLIDFSGGHSFYKAGVKVEGAFIDVRLFHKSELEPKKKYTAEVFSLLSRELGIKNENMYLNISEFENWGSNGQFN